MDPPPIDIEEDIPPGSSEASETQLSKNKVNLYEKSFNIFKSYKDIELRDKSFKLIKKLITLIMLFYIVDMVLINYGLKSSELLDSIFELFKYLLSTLFGFVFALKRKEE